MKLNKEQLDKIKETNHYLIKTYEWFADYKSDLIYSDEQIKEIIEEEEDIETLEFIFPGEEDPIYIEPDDFIELSEEIKSIEIINNGLIKTKHCSYYIVSSSDSYEDFILSNFHLINIEHSNGINIRLTDESFIVGLAAIELGEYDLNEERGAISPYLSIEIIYENPTLRDEVEKELVDSFIFEIADTTNVALNFSEISNPYSKYYHDEEEIEDFLSREIRGLEPYNEGMKLFTSAVQIKDSELKFLNFYKVLEHFSPVAVNIEANELMRKKLDAPKKNFVNGDFIRSIFELANSMREKFKDEDLIIAAFNTCFDFVGLFNKLPISIQTKIKKSIQAKELTYSTEKQKISTAINIAGKIIYKTRNKVVHAKSNFNSKGDEIPSSEFEELNEFMKEASSQSIRWYSRQPNHLKLEIIK